MNKLFFYFFLYFYFFNKSIKEIEKKKFCKKE